MGGSVQARCSCGYESDLLLVGGGMADLGQKCMAPAYSKRQKKVVLRNYWGKKGRGRSPGGAIFYTDPRLSEPLLEATDVEIVFSWGWGQEDKPDFCLPDVTYKCPKCDAMQMRFVQGNLMWD